MSRPDDIPPAIWERAEILTDELRHIEDDRELVARILMAEAPTPAGVTPKQAQALIFIGDFITAHGHSPTLAEIATGLGIATRSRAHQIVTALLQRGLVTSIPNAARSIRPTSLELH